MTGLRFILAVMLIVQTGNHELLAREPVLVLVEPVEVDGSIDALLYENLPEFIVRIVDSVEGVSGMLSEEHRRQQEMSARDFAETGRVSSNEALLRRSREYDSAIRLIPHLMRVNDARIEVKMELLGGPGSDRSASHTTAPNRRRLERAAKIVLKVLFPTATFPRTEGIGAPIPERKGTDYSVRCGFATRAEWSDYRSHVRSVIALQRTGKLAEALVELRALQDFLFINLDCFEDDREKGRQIMVVLQAYAHLQQANKKYSEACETWSAISETFEKHCIYGEQKDPFFAYYCPLTEEIILTGNSVCNVTHCRQEALDVHFEFLLSKSRMLDRHQKREVLWILELFDEGLDGDVELELSRLKSEYDRFPESLQRFHDCVSTALYGTEYLHDAVTSIGPLLRAQFARIMEAVDKPLAIARVHAREVLEKIGELRDQTGLCGFPGWRFWSRFQRLSGALDLLPEGLVVQGAAGDLIVIYKDVPGRQAQGIILVGRSEVTYEKYLFVRGRQPVQTVSGNVLMPDVPVSNVSMNDARLFSNELSALEGWTECYGKNLEPIPGCNGYRLPTLEEALLAAYGGHSDEMMWPWYRASADLTGDKVDTYREQHAWCGFSGKNHPQPVCSCKNNHPWGLCDIIGNLQEWVEEGPAVCTAIGGSYLSATDYCVFTEKGFHEDNGTSCSVQPSADIGFRIVRTLR